MKEEDIKTMLQQYMQENEILRTENSQLHEMRELLTRDHELVCRENERLLRFAREAERYNRSPPLPNQRRQSPSLRSHLGSSDSLLDSTTVWPQHQESWRSLMDLSHEMDGGDLGDFKMRTPPDSKKNIHVGYSSTRRKVGKSMSDISENKVEMARQDGLQRRNSWGSGIPRPVDKRSSPTSPATKDVHTPPTPPQKLPPLMTALVPKFGRRNTNKLADKVAGKAKNPMEDDIDIVPRDLEQVQKAIRGES